MTTLRVLIALLIGAFLALTISAVTYYNDKVIEQTYLIGNHLPIAVFGVLVVLMLGVNPLLRLIGKSMPLSPGQLAIITALGMAVCGWPGSNYYRTLSGNIAMPAHLYKNQTAWQAARVLSYIPGGSGLVAPGQVLNAREVSQRVTDHTGPLWKDIRGSLRPTDLTQLREIRDIPPDQLLDTHYMLVAKVLNEAIEKKLVLPHVNAAEMGGDVERWINEADRRFQAVSAATGGSGDEIDPSRLKDMAAFEYGQAIHAQQQAARAALVELTLGAIAPAPPGDGVLVGNGVADEFVINTLVGGRDRSAQLSITELPWSAWWPAIRLWGGVGIGLALASLCLTLIVHPQWSSRELLPYPIARFVSEFTAPGPHGFLPMVARNKLFWMALLIVLGIHMLNGLQLIFPALPNIPLNYQFSALMNLFPTARQVYGSGWFYNPTFFLSVIAFAFFLNTTVSFSIGINALLWIMFGSLLIGQGIAIENEYFQTGLGPMLRCGAYIGLTVILLYIGRRYYLNVAASAIGLPRGKETPAYATWAARALVVLFIGCVALLQIYADLHWVVGAMLIGLMLLKLLVITRINVETGMFWMQAWWVPSALVLALLGPQGLGPTALIVIGLATAVLISDPRTAFMPYFANALKISEDVADRSPKRMVTPIVAVVLLGFVVALIATLYLQYNTGKLQSDTWAAQSLPKMPFDALAKDIRVLSSRGELQETIAAGPWARLLNAEADWGALGWLAIGFVLVLICSFGRLRLPWWPLHPVAFLLWGSYPGGLFAASFLVGFFIKFCVVKFGGARAYGQIKPMMVGVIAGELLAAIIWTLVNTAYYLVMDQSLMRFQLLPG